MPDSAEAVRNAFDAIENNLSAETAETLETVGTEEWAVLAGSRYQVAALREIAVQLARIADLIENRVANAIEALERRAGQ